MNPSSVILILLAAINFTLASHEVLDDESEEFIPPGSLSAFMEMAYNKTIPYEARKECELKGLNACPSTDKAGAHPCIANHDICNGITNCPESEDENRTLCFFYHIHTNEIKRMRVLAVRALRRSHSQHIRHKHHHSKHHHHKHQ